MNTTQLRSDTTAEASPTNPFSQGGLLDQMFDASFPWKLLKAFSPEGTFTRGETGFAPAIDVKSDAKAYTLTAELAGIPKDQVKLEIHDGVLTLSGQKKEESGAEEVTRHVGERRYGAFSRSLSLPEDADQEHITASHKDGVLTITIPRTTPAAHRKVITIA